MGCQALVLLTRLKLEAGPEAHKKQKLHLQRSPVDKQKQKILILGSLDLQSLVQTKRSLKENQVSKELLQKMKAHLIVDHQEMS